MGNRNTFTDKGCGGHGAECSTECTAGSMSSEVSFHDLHGMLRVKKLVDLMVANDADNKRSNERSCCVVSRVIHALRSSCEHSAVHVRMRVERSTNGFRAARSQVTQAAVATSH